MKSSTKDQIEGKAHEVKGTIKAVAGQILDDDSLEVEGQVEVLAGKVQGKIGEIKKVVGK